MTLYQFLTVLALLAAGVVLFLFGGNEGISAAGGLLGTVTVVILAIFGVKQLASRKQPK